VNQPVRGADVLRENLGAIHGCGSVGGTDRQFVPGHCFQRLSVTEIVESQLFPLNDVILEDVCEHTLVSGGHTFLR
jgi:hypothetical protein